MPFLRVEVRPSFRDIKRRFVKADEALLEAKRREMRNLGREFVRISQDEAPKGKTGKFARGITYRTFQRGETITMTSSMPQPLGKWITEGTRPHWIQAKNKRALSFFWPKVGMRVVVPRQGGFRTHVHNDVFWIGKGGVNHPGTKANPFHHRAYRRWRPQAELAVRRMAVNWQMGLTR